MTSIHPGRLTWNLQITHEKKGKWSSRHPWGHVPAVNLPGCICSSIPTPTRWGPLTTISGFIPSYTHLQPWFSIGFAGVISLPYNGPGGPFLYPLLLHTPQGGVSLLFVSRRSQVVWEAQSWDAIARSKGGWATWLGGEMDIVTTVIYTPRKCT